MSDPVSKKYSYLVPIDFLNDTPSSSDHTTRGLKRAGLDDLDAMKSSNVRFHGIRAPQSSESNLTLELPRQNDSSPAKVSGLIPYAATGAAAAGVGAALSAVRPQPQHAGIAAKSGAAGAGLTLLAVLISGGLCIGYFGGFFDPPRDFREQFKKL